MAVDRMEWVHKKNLGEKKQNSWKLVKNILRENDFIGFWEGFAISHDIFLISW